MATEEIIIPYSPRPLQAAVHAALLEMRWNVVVTHRRFGKTVMGVVHLVMSAMGCERPMPRFAYIAPYLKMAKAIAWDYLKTYTKTIPGCVYNETELKVVLPNEATVRLYGVDNPDALRGQYFDGVVCDEYGMFPPRAFPEVIRPCLADRAGWCVFQGTPNGKNQFFDVYEKAKTDERYGLHVFPYNETRILPEEEIADMRRELTEEQFAAEMECDFTSSVVGNYFGSDLRRAREEGRLDALPIIENLPVHTAWDLGFSDSTSIVMWQNYQNWFHVVDYYESSGVSLKHYVDHIQSLGYTWGEHFAPHDIKVHDLGSGLSRLDVAHELGISLVTLPRLPVQDGINAIRTVFNRCRFDRDRCKRLIECLQNYRRMQNQTTGEFMERPHKDQFSHGADSFRYFAMAQELVDPGDKHRNRRVYSSLGQPFQQFA